MDRLCDRLLVLDGNGNVEPFADVGQWMNSRQRKQPARVESRSAPPPRPPLPTLRENSQGKNARNSTESRVRSKKAEQMADSLKKRLEDSAIMSDADKLSEIYAEHESTRKKFDDLYSQWETLENELGD